MRVVLDTNVLVSSTLWVGSANKTLLLLIETNVKIFVSKKILDEFERIILRDFPEVSGRLPELMENIMAFSTITESSVSLDVVKADPEDNKIIECAVSSMADFIVTYDKHLLKIKEYDGVRIVTPEHMRVLLSAV